MKTLRLLLVLLMLTSISVAYAQEGIIGVEPDEIDVLFAPMGSSMNTSMDFVPANGDCSTAAGSYLAPEMMVRLTRNVILNDNTVLADGDFDQIATNFNAMLNSLAVDAHRLSSAANSGDGDVLPEGTLVTTTGNMVCLDVFDGTAMFWEVVVNNSRSTGWLMESIRWEQVEVGQAPLRDESVEYGPVIKVKPKGLAETTTYALQDVLVTSFQPVTQSDSLSAYFLAPFVLTLTPELAGSLPTSVTTGDGNQVCDKAAPSFISMDESAWYIWRSVAQNYSPQGEFNRLQDTGATVEYAFEPFIEKQYYDTLIFEPPQTLDIAPAPATEFENIVSGPVCVSETFAGTRFQYPGTNAEIQYDYQTEFVIVWWEVEAIVNNALMTMWLPESIARYYVDNHPDNPQDNWIHMYFLTPDSQMQGDAATNLIDTIQQGTATRAPQSPYVVPNDTEPQTTSFSDGVRVASGDINGDGISDVVCNVANTNFADGSDVQPAQSRMNLRVRPSVNADVIGMVEMDETVQLIGSPVSADGYLWWYTNRNGWIAEYQCGEDAAVLIGLLLPAVQKVNPEPPANNNDDTTVNPPAPQPQPQPTEEPRPPADDCDPTTGRGCDDGTPTDPEPCDPARERCQ